MIRRSGIAILALVLVAACTQSTLVPPGAVDPRANLTLYLDALKAGNCEAARAMALTSFTIGNGELCGALSVTTYSIDGAPARPSDGEAVFSTTLTTSGGDASMPDGRHTWFYTLERQANGEWLISGGGSGP